MTAEPSLNGTGLAERAQAPSQDALDKSVRVPRQSEWDMSGGAMSTLFFAARYDNDMAAWGTGGKLRDQQLRQFITVEPIFASALGVVVSRNAAFSWTIEGPPRVTARMQRMMQSANFGRGWADFIGKISTDLYTQDYGAFFEVIREADSPASPVISIAHLDAARCHHTGNPETPVVYQDRLGQFHALKWYQVCALSEMPAAYEEPPGMQYSALTRMLRAAQILRDVSTYLQEKIGGQHARAITLVKGVTSEQISAAWATAREQNMSAGLLKFSQPVFVGTLDPKADVGFSTLDLAGLPDGFDLDLSYKQYVAQIAMAFLSDYQDFAPLPGGNLGSGSQSEILHLKSRGKGPALFQKIMEQALNWNVLPEDVEFKFTEQDEASERTQAEIKGMRATERATRITSQEISPQVARQLAYDAGDLTEEMLEMLKQQDETEEIILEDQHQIEDEHLDDDGTPEAQTGDGDDTLEEGERALAEKHTPGGQGHNQASHGGGMPDGWSASEPSIEHKGDDVIVKIKFTTEFEIPKGPRKGEVIKQKEGEAYAQARFKDGELRLNSIIVPDEVRGGGFASNLVSSLGKEATSKGVPLTTTGVYSKDGRKLMDRYVDSGKAKELPGGRHEFVLEKFKSKTQDRRAGPDARLEVEAEVERLIEDSFDALRKRLARSTGMDADAFVTED